MPGPGPVFKNGQYFESPFKIDDGGSKWLGDGLLIMGVGPFIDTTFEYRASPSFEEPTRNIYRVWTLFGFRYESHLTIEPRNNKLHFSRGVLASFYKGYYWDDISDLGQIKEFPLPLAEEDC